MLTTALLLALLQCCYSRTCIQNLGYAYSISLASPMPQNPGFKSVSIVWILDFHLSLPILCQVSWMLDRIESLFRLRIPLSKAQRRVRIPKSLVPSLEHATTDTLRYSLGFFLSPDLSRFSPASLAETRDLCLGVGVSGFINNATRGPPRFNYFLRPSTP